MENIGSNQNNKVKVKATTEHVYDLLKEMIFDWHLAPDQKINIDQLARDMKISAIPIREALSRLHADNILIFESFKGYRVNPLLDGKGINELLESRLLIETFAVECIIRSNKLDVVQRLKVLNEQIAATKASISYRNFKDFNQFDGKFHTLIVEATENRFLLEAYNGMHCHLHLARLYHERGEVDQLEAINEHNLIIDALETRDIYHAQSAVKSHIEGAKSRLRQK